MQYTINTAVRDILRATNACRTVILQSDYSNASTAEIYIDFEQCLTANDPGFTLRAGDLVILDDCNQSIYAIASTTGIKLNVTYYERFRQDDLNVLTSYEPKAVST